MSAKRKPRPPRRGARARVDETAWALLDHNGKMDRSSSGIGAIYLYVSKRKAEEACVWRIFDLNAVRVRITEVAKPRARRARRARG